MLRNGQAFKSQSTRRAEGVGLPRQAEMPRG